MVEWIKMKDQLPEFGIRVTIHNGKNELYGEYEFDSPSGGDDTIAWFEPMVIGAGGVMCVGRLIHAKHIIKWKLVECVDA